MNTYFKYTDGDAFTLNGSDYIGYFNITDGIAYTGRKITSDSLVLSAKNNILSDIYTNLIHFDTTYKNVSPLRRNYSNYFDILNTQGISNLLSSVDYNNLVIFKNLILENPTLFKYDASHGYFYGLSSLNEENVNNIPLKHNKTNTIPFEETNNFKFLDSVHTSTFVVDSYDNFKYLCADTNGLYKFTGSFTDNKNLNYIDSVPNDPYYNVIHDIHQDISDQKIFIVRNDEISIYDSSNYYECDKLILEDVIPLPQKSKTTEYIWDKVDISFDALDITFDTSYTTDNPNNPEFVKIGQNYRTILHGDLLYLYNKYSSNLFDEFNLKDYGISNILDLDIRDVDDLISIFHKIDDLYKITFILPSDKSYNTYDMYSLSNGDTSKIEFVYHDSNLFSIRNEKEYQHRCITHPEYPCSRLDLNDLDYIPTDYIWDETDQVWNYFQIPWDGNSSKSNNYNNLIASSMSKYGKMYMILHNIGRIYALNQNMGDRYLNFVPFDMVKNYTGVQSVEHSLGLSLNFIILNILKDTLNLFNQSSSSFTLMERGLILSQIENFTLEIENLYINGNESVNTIVLQRVLKLLTDLQLKLQPKT